MKIPFTHNHDYKTLVDREGELWGQSKNEVGISWFDSRTISRYIHRCISGHPEQDWLDYIKKHYFPKPAFWGLNAGCGHGELERLILKRKITEKMDGFDISAKAVERARENAAQEGMGEQIRYFHADANYLENSDLRDQYDVIFAAMALHHFSELEKCLEGFREKLKPGGLFITNEYIGPTRFQWTDIQLEAANRLLACFPMELKRNLRDPQNYKREVLRPSLSFMKKHMAFESICSERIVPALKDCFEILDRKNYGGTLLHLVFEAIMGNFKEETNREHAVMVRMAIEYEKSLLDYGVLQHDHALLICRKS